MVLIVTKPNGEVRTFVDLTELNKFVERVDPLPVGEHIFGQLFGARYFSKIDASLAFGSSSLPKSHEQ